MVDSRSPSAIRHPPSAICHPPSAICHSPFAMTTVLYQATKYDGSLNYQWQTQLEYHYDNLIILYAPVNTPFSGRRSGLMPYATRIYLWTDRWYNVEQYYMWNEGRGVRHYV